jgi:hypothetical protein
MKSMTSDQDRQEGFSLLEAVLAISIAITVIGAVFTVLGPSRGIVEAQPEFTDMQQRLRVGVDILLGDLMMAGAGAYAGTHTGSLVEQFAPILPFRRGSSAAYDDGPGVFRGDAVTIAYVPSTSSQTILRSPMTDVTSVEVDSESGCPVNDPPCGFKPGTSAIVYDGTGAFDAFSVTSADAGGTLTVQPLQQGSLATAYAAGAKIVEVVRHAYFLDGPSQQLMRYDGLAAAAAVLDNVVGLDFQYYADPAPPEFRNPGRDQSVSYGPAPPALDASLSRWPPGENCMWRVSSGVQVPRLVSLAAGGPGLVPLTPSQLTDGPWCPDDASANRYDADLFRVRRVRVRIRLQTGNALLRASLASGRGALFANPGTAMNAARMVPDQSIQFDISPRNMNSSR